MPINTVNVVEFSYGNVEQLVSFKETAEDNKEAEKFFAQCIKENGGTKSDIECAIEDGHYANENGYEIFLIHSTVPEAIQKNTSEFKSTGMVWEAFSVDDSVNVHRKEDDIFNNDFTGRVIDKNATHIIVEDQHGDCFTCDPDQLSFNTDSYMHD